jgi:hemoglobin-like flavoprotein
MMLEDVTIKLSNPELIEYVNTVSPTEIQLALMIGKHCLTSTGIVLKDERFEAIERNIADFKESLTPFIDKVNELSGMLKVSVTKGKAMENTVYNCLTETLQYTKWNITNVSNKSDESDIRVVTDRYTILVETKNYKTLVSHAQIDKLMKDIECTNADCALMVSMNSSIANRSSMEMETVAINGKHVTVMYISNATLPMVVAGILTLNANGSTGIYTANSTVLMKQIERLSVLLTSIHTVRMSVAKLRIDTNSCIDTLYRTVYDHELQINTLVNDINDSLQTERIIASVTATSTDTDVTNALIQTRQQYTLLDDLINTIKETVPLLIKSKDNELIIVYTKLTDGADIATKPKVIAITHSYKKRVDLRIFVTPKANTVSVNHLHETYNDNMITITVESGTIGIIKNRIIEECNS